MPEGEEIASYPEAESDPDEPVKDEHDPDDDNEEGEGVVPPDKRGD